MVVGLIYYSLAFAVLLIYSVIATIPVALEDAAAINGAGRAGTFWRVVIPLSLPGIAAVSLTVFSLSMGAFAAAALMGGGRVLTLPVLIYQTVFLDNEIRHRQHAVGDPAGYRPSGERGGWSADVPDGRQIVPQDDKHSVRPPRRIPPFFIAALRVSTGRRLSPIARPLGRILAMAWIGATYVLLFAPLLVVVLASFNGGSFRAGAVVFPPRHLSLDWYLATPYSHVHAFGVSSILAFIATALACLLAIPAGLGLVRSRVRARDAIAALFRIPLQVPVVIIGLAFFYTCYAVDDALGTSSPVHSWRLSSRISSF